MSSNQPNQVQNNSISSGSSSLSLSSEDLSVSNKKVNLLSHPLTKAQLEKAKGVIDNKLDINRNLPDKQAYIDKEGHIKVAKVTRYIPTNLILTKSGELVLKNAQQQVDYMNFIGESSSTGTENKKKNISNNENINLQIQKLMNKVNHLSASINNTQQADTQESVINNPFINSTGDDGTFGNKSQASTPLTPIAKNFTSLNHNLIHSKSNNPFSSPAVSINAQKSNSEATIDAANTNNNLENKFLGNNNSHMTMEKGISGNSIIPSIVNNSNISTVTRSSAESVTSSAFIENNFPKYLNLNKSEYKLPTQSAPYVPKSAGSTSNKNANRNSSSAGKRIFSTINKKFKNSNNLSPGTSTNNDKEIYDKYSNQIKKKQTDWNSIDIRKYEGLLPWESHVELMQWVDPQPSFPPSYHKCNPQAMGKGSGVNFPIYEDDQNNNKSTAPPDYKPGIEGITVVAMKVEFLSPFDRAMMRSWKYYILELNSTQINFYHLDEELTNDIPNFWDGKDDSCQIREKEKNNDFSSYTDMYSVVNGKKVWTNNGTGFYNNSHVSGSTKDKNTEDYIMSKAENRQILQKLMNKPANYLTNERLCKSFSLQNSDFGIATDCNERAYILRVRCEMEQFSLSFSSVMDMINWSVYLSVGIGISLDLDERPYPNYRIVPIGSSRSRRRRQRRLREERRQRLLSEHEHRKKVFASAPITSVINNSSRKNSSGVAHKSSFMKLTSRLRSASHSSNNTTGVNIEASENRRNTLPDLNDHFLEDESSSLLELCSTIEADRRRRMSSTNLTISNNSIAETGSQASNSRNVENNIVEDAIEDEEDEDDHDYIEYEYDEYEYQEQHAEAYDDGSISRRPSEITNHSLSTINRVESDVLQNAVLSDDSRQIERENRRLMEEYTSLTIRRVLKEDEIEENANNNLHIPNYNKDSTQNTADIDRSNPALVLTHALTNITFAPSKKKNNTLASHKKTSSREISAQNLRSRSSSANLSSVKKILRHSKPSPSPSDSEKSNESSGKKFISKLFGKKTDSNKNIETSAKKNRSNSSGITVDNVITFTPNVRRKSLASTKRDVKFVNNGTSSREPTNPVFDHEESEILAEERNIMEDELQLEARDNDENQDMNEILGDPKVSPTLEGSENTYEREGLQVEEAGDYIYQPQKLELYSSTDRIARARGTSLSSVSPMNSETQKQRNRSASYHSQLMNYGNNSMDAHSDYKSQYDGDSKYIWSPPKKIMTKKKYIREAIGCIKPLLENETWHGKVISTPCLAPEYETNNPPISGVLEELGKIDLENSRNSSIFKYGFSQHDNKAKPKFKLILRRCKNHYLKQSVVGPSGYVRL